MFNTDIRISFYQRDNEYIFDVIPQEIVRFGNICAYMANLGRDDLGDILLNEFINETRLAVNNEYKHIKKRSFECLENLSDYPVWYKRIYVTNAMDMAYRIINIHEDSSLYRYIMEEHASHLSSLKNITVGDLYKILHSEAKTRVANMQSISRHFLNKETWTMKFVNSNFQDYSVRLININGKYERVIFVTATPGLLIWDIVNIIEHKIEINKCSNCGLYFVPENRSDTKYCTQPAPQDSSKTCQEYGAYTAWVNRTKTDGSYKLYRQIYMKMQMAVKRNIDIETYKNDFDLFKEETKKWKQSIKDGQATEEEYIAWLEQFNERSK